MDNETLENNSKVYYNGSKWKTNKHGYVIIIARVKSEIIGNQSYLCQFDDGTIVRANHSDIRHGEVKNPNATSVAGVGYFGQGKHQGTINGKQTREYKLWNNMINRCYNEKNLLLYPTYRGVEVCERWKSYQNFCEDLPKIKNYEKWKNSNIPLEYHLDKDINSDSFKIYNLKSCMFVLAKDNTEEMNRRTIHSKLTGLTYVATRISDGYQEEFTNQSEFARNWNLDQSHIKKCIKKKCGYKTHKG